MPASRAVSVIIPVYNEAEYVEAIVAKVLKQRVEGVEFEIIAVDDASDDGSREILSDLAARDPGKIRILRHETNRGKGACVRTGIEAATGDYVLLQDADLEYEPDDYPRLLGPLLDHRADAVYGSRFLVSDERRVLYFWHSVANRILTTICNVVSDLNLTDMGTGYKAFRTSFIRSLPLRASRFGIEPEITIKLAQRQARIYEVPVRYHGRTYAEGKKVGLADAFEALAVIARYAFARDIYTDPGARILDTLSQTDRFNQWMADVLAEYCGSRVLEIGAGIGNLSRRLSRRRRSYVASDYDHEHLERLRVTLHHRPNIEVVRCDLAGRSDFEPLAERFDTVICLNVLEHIDDDMTGLANIFSALEPGGRAIILVPQDQKIFGTLDEVLGHFRRYSQQELAGKLKSTGFEVERTFEFNRVTRPGWFINGRILKRRHFGRFQIAMFDRAVPLWRRIDRFFPWPGVSLIAVAKKPAVARCQ